MFNFKEHSEITMINFVTFQFQLEDCNYKSLDPDTIRLPPPAPPSERLLAAVKAFYAPPGHDHPRDR